MSFPPSSPGSLFTGELRTVTHTNDLEKFILEVTPEDLVITLRATAYNELRDQEQIGNKASNVITDGGKRPLFEAQRRVQMLFGDRAALLAALTKAHDMLIKSTRIKSGAARRSYVVYMNGKMAGYPGDLVRLVERVELDATLSIVGPLVPYARKLYWNPAGPYARPTKRAVGTRTFAGGITTKVFATGQEPMHRAVRRLLKRDYPQLYVAERWQESNVRFPDGTTVPAITIGLKTKGLLN